MADIGVEGALVAVTDLVTNAIRAVALAHPGLDWSTFEGELSWQDPEDATNRISVGLSDIAVEGN